MPKIIPLKASEVIKKMKKCWYQGPYTWGRHLVMKKENQSIPVPFHWGKDVSAGVIASIIEWIWISVDERNKL